MKTLLRVGYMLLLWTGNASAQQVVDRIVAQVNNDIITLSDLNRELAVARRELASRYTGAQLEAELKKAQEQALDNLINEKLLLQKATELGFGANVDIQVSAYVERMRKEYNFKDMEQFEQALAQQGFTMAGYRDYLRKQYIIQGLIQEFVSSRITLLSEEIERYYRDHKADFSTPEEVSLSEIVIPMESGSDSDAASRAAEIHNRLTQGESFAALASQYSKGPTASKGGSIGSYVTGKLAPEIVQAIANVKEGEITPVTKENPGYVIYRVDSRKPSATKPLDEVRDKIKETLWEQKFEPEKNRFLAQLKEDAYIQIFTEIKP
jgi:peptidyl-prolyl cis-trans isomerase SurA